MSDYLIPASHVTSRTAWSGSESLIDPEPWVQQALCAESDPEAFFPEKGGSTMPAKAVCSRCDVQAECLAYALRTRQSQGIWGGLAVRERAALLRGDSPQLRGVARTNRVQKMLDEGWGVPEIAASCGVSVKTIEREIERLQDEAAA